jgi:nucleotide-binding universal stress UspA family protein
MHRKALVPVDGSEIGRAALDEVAHLLGPAGEALLVEVVDTPTRIITQTTPAGFYLGGSVLDGATLESMVAAQRRAATEHLAEARAALEAAGLGTVTTRILDGLPGPELVATAYAEACDVIVMATHGRSGILRTFLGSVADYVVRHTHGIPVVLVRPETDDEQPAAILEASTLA